MAFDAHFRRKFADRSKRYPHMRAKINGRPAHEVVAERERQSIKDTRNA